MRLANGRYFCWLILSILLIACGQSSRTGTTPRPLLVRSMIIPVDSLLERDARMEAFLKPYSAQIDFAAGQSIGRLSKPLAPPSETDELFTLVARMIAAELQESGQQRPHAIILDARMVTAGLDSGAVTLGDLYRVLPHDQDLVLFQIQSGALKTLLKSASNEANVFLFDVAAPLEDPVVLVATADLLQKNARLFQPLHEAMERHTTGLRQLMIRGFRRAGTVAADRYFGGGEPLSVGENDES